MSKDQRVKAFFSSAALALSLLASPAFADTIFEAMAAAYNNNANLNAARAGARATDESVPLAKSAMRPQVSADGSLLLSDSDRSGSLAVGSFGINIDQVLFDGNQTRNNVASAEAQVRASQYGLANSTQNVLFDAATAYSDVYRDRQVASLRKQAISFLTEQQRAAQARFQVGEGTRTDVAQADAQRAGAIAEATAAQAQVKSSEAVYKQVTGLTPGKLKAPTPASKSLPKTIDAAFAQAASNHPAVMARLNSVDASEFNVKAKQGELLPELSARARVEAEATDTQSGSSSENSASLSAQLRIPIYTGGRVDAQVRQSKEQLAQARLQVDESRDQVRAAVASAWANLESARAVLSSSQEQIEAAQIALNGLIEERNVGQRTTLDVLNGQNQLLDAQIARVDAERNLVVASYAVLSAVGALKPEVIGLTVERYDPQVNFEAVKDKWFGLRTVDGR
jgi:outer membrane protein